MTRNDGKQGVDIDGNAGSQNAEAFEFLVVLHLPLQATDVPVRPAYGL